MFCKFAVAVWFAMVAVVVGNDIQDISIIQLVVIPLTGNRLEYTISLNADSIFYPKLRSIESGFLTIEMNGVCTDDTVLFSGAWSGVIPATGEPSHILVYLVDLNPALLSPEYNYAPFFTSVEILPSTIATNHNIEIKTSVHDFDNTPAEMERGSN
jgi:hypothetical protein